MLDTKELNEKQHRMTLQYDKILSGIQTFVEVLDARLQYVLEDFVAQDFFTMANDNLLKNKDDEIYEVCHYVCQCYIKVLGLYEDGKKHIKSERKVKILNGLQTILVSQVTQFEESTNPSLKNPIMSEKKTIISETLMGFQAEYEKIIEKLAQYRMAEIKAEVVQQFFTQPYCTALHVTQQLLNKKYEQLFHALCPVLFAYQKTCLRNINDLNKRKVTTNYFSMLKQEHEILTSIIKIQVAPLEEMSKNKDSSREAHIIRNILTVLREAYQSVSKKVDVLSAFLSEAATAQMAVETKDDVLWMTKFDQLVTEKAQEFNADFMDMEHRLNQNVQNFGKGLYYDTRRHFEQQMQNDSEKTKADCEERGQELEQMLLDIRQCFEHFVYFYNSKVSVFEQHTEQEIVNGIDETLRIKLESMTENQAEFTEKYNGLLQALDYTPTKGTKEEIFENAQQALILWNEMVGGPIEDFYERLRVSSSLATILDKESRQFQTKLEKINKYFMTFKRNHILEEVVSFEEIKNYSIQRLEENECDQVKGYVSVFYRIQERINDILHQHRIEPIVPKPHEMFNPKTHEVLLADQVEGFTKGEIIKTVASGFVEDGVVLLRANVIASR